MARVKGPAPPTPDCPYGPKLFSSPREAFVFSDLSPALEDLAEVWTGVPIENRKSSTWDLPGLRRAALAERWEDQRRLFMDSVRQATIRAYGEKIGEQEVANLEEATKRHRAAVQSLSLYASGKMVGKTRPDGKTELCFEEQGVPLTPKASDVIRAIKEYVQLDRQVLGLADLRFTIHAWLRRQFKHEDRIKSLETLVPELVKPLMREGISDVVDRLVDRVKELEKWRVETNEHLGEMNHCVGTLHEGVKQLLKVVSEIQLAGAKEVADAMLEVGRMKVEVAGLKSITSNVKDRLGSVESKFPQYDGYADPCHSFFSED